MTDHTQKVALITGASRGIGAAIAQRLVADDFAVAINYSSSANEAIALVDAIEQSGGMAVAIRADVANSGQVKEMFEQVRRQLGEIDVLVNNAGILKTAPLVESSDALFDQTFAINARGVFNTLREAAKHLKAGGRVVNLSSTTLALDLPGYAIYNGTKAAVEAFTRVFAKELRGRQISVNSVAPGPVATDLFLAGKSEEQIANFAIMPALERLGQPSDIAGIVAFLAGPEGGWINGQTIRANGGLG